VGLHLIFFLFCFRSMETTSVVHSEDDIPGAKLPHANPKQCSIPQLKHWLACRGISSTRLKTKAEVVVRVQGVIDSKSENTIIDPTYKEKIYTRRKQEGLPVTITVGPSHEPDHITPPKHGWTTDLKDLPQFNDVTISEFTEHTGKTANYKSCVRPEHRGYQLFSESYIHSYQTCKTDSYYFIKANCYRSLCKNEAPHTIWLALTFPSGITSVSKAYCSCKAGASGYCNHVLATMYQTSHFCKLACKTVPLRGSKTEYPQLWDKPTRGKKIKPVSVMHEQVKKAKVGEGWKAGQKCSLFEARENVCNSSELINEVKSDLKEQNANYGFVSMATEDTDKSEYVLTRAPIGTLVPQGSVLSYQLSTSESNFETSSIDTSLFCVNACSSTCEIDSVFPSFPSFPLNSTGSQPSCPVHQSVIVTKDEAVQLERETIHQSNCDKWFEERSKRLTSSTFYDIISRKTKKHEKFLSRLTSSRKCNISKMPDSLRHGIENEDVAVKSYFDYMNIISHPVQVFVSGLVVNPAFPHLACSPDRKVIDAKCHPHFGIMEVKCPFSARELTPLAACAYFKDDAKFSLTTERGSLVLKEDCAHMVQIQAQMAFTGAKWCDYVIYTFKGLHVQRIWFNEKFWSEHILPVVNKFYIEHFEPYILSK
jgi:hypothetical protein